MQIMVLKSTSNMRSFLFLILALIVASCLLTAGCSSTPPAVVDSANQKRWENFQKDNKKERSVAMDAFEKRQAQLAEKKRKEAEKSAAKPGVQSAPAGAAEKKTVSP
jgi:outer membrane biogenesis lipoprotein LolB